MLNRYGLRARLLATALATLAPIVPAAAQTATAPAGAVLIPQPDPQFRRHAPCDLHRQQKGRRKQQKL